MKSIKAPGARPRHPLFVAGILIAPTRKLNIVGPKYGSALRGESL